MAARLSVSARQMSDQPLLYRRVIIDSIAAVKIEPRLTAGHGWPSSDPVPRLLVIHVT